MDAHYYRGLTDRAKKSTRAKEQERLLQKVVDDFVSTAPMKCERAARAGENSAYIAEFLVHDPRDCEPVIKRLKIHFTNKGFKWSVIHDQTYKGYRSGAKRYLFQISW